MRNTRDGEVIRESNASTCVFHSRDRRTSSFAATKIKEKKDEYSSSLLARPEMVNTRVPCNLQWRSTRKGCQKIRWYGRRGLREYKISHEERRKRNGRNNVFILCARLNVFPRFAFRRQQWGEKKKDKRKKKEEKKQRDWNVSWSCEWIYIIVSTMLSFSPDRIAVDYGGGPPILDFAA